MYTTYNRILDELKGTQAYSTAATAQQLMQYARTVTNRIKGYGYQFEPQYITKKITPTRANTNLWAGTLTLKDYLLEPISITVGGTAVTFGTDVVSEPDDGQYPIQALRIVNPTSAPINSWFPCCGPAAGSIVIPGFWGMRTEYASQGFFDSTVTCPVLSSSQTTMVVSNATELDVYYRTPLFSAGNLIRIDNELMEIVNVNSGTRTLTVRRGVNGSAAVAHTVGTAIRIWECEPDIANCATRQAALLFARRGAYMQTTTYPDGISVSYPSDLLAEIRATIQRFNYVIG